MARSTETSISRWGNSAGLRIPRKVAEQAGLREGDQVQLEVEAPGVMVVRAVKGRPTLENLVARITARNRHKEAPWGRPLGNEIW